MNLQILGDKKRIRYDEGLVDVVNKKFEQDNLDESDDSSVLQPLDFSKIIFESTAKNRMNFVESLEDMNIKDRFLSRVQGGTFLVGRNYDRHPRPREVFEWLYLNESVGLNTCEAKLYLDIMATSPEWMSCAFKFEGKILSVALDPQNFVFNEKTDYLYSVKHPLIICSEQKDFVLGKSCQEFLTIKDFPKELIEYLYGSVPISYLEKEGAHIQILPEGRWYPVSRGRFNLMIVYNVAHSRGVKIRE